MSYVVCRFDEERERYLFVQKKRGMSIFWTEDLNMAKPFQTIEGADQHIEYNALQDALPIYAARSAEMPSRNKKRVTPVQLFFEEKPWQKIWDFGEFIVVQICYPNDPNTMNYSINKFSLDLALSVGKPVKIRFQEKARSNSYWEQPASVVNGCSLIRRWSDREAFYLVQMSRVE